MSSATATALKPIHRPMEVSVYPDNGRWGFWFSNGPVMHRQGGFTTELEAKVAGQQDRAETIAYAHRFEPRATVMFDPKDGSRFVTGWAYKCACGLVRSPNNARGTATLIRDDSGPCLAAARVKARAA